MKKILILGIATTAILSATNYCGIIDTLKAQVAGYQYTFDKAQDYAIDAVAGSSAIASIDFNPSHEGWSGGIGLGTTDSHFGRGNAGALGIQYGFKDNTAMNVKGWTTGGGTYAVGLGLVKGF